MKPIIEIKNIGKKYNITHQRGGYVALRDVLTSVAKSPFKFLASKAKQVVGINTKEEFWALKNVSFDVMPGEIIGVIGANGAGKSTLLKILTGITPPTEGEIIMRGRVASLLEVGTGFHPELTGRENIFLNGAILGMTKKEIVQKFDEIVAFAGVEKFLDTPVKYYSSGMHVRLAFSVAAHMEPEILLVDEVLAVGDAEFQKKCLGKMEEVTKKDGRTILFVSHNMAAVGQLCKKTILLKKGRVVLFDDTEKVISNYEELGDEGRDLSKIKRRGDGKVRITSFHIENVKGEKTRIVMNGDVEFVFGYESAEPETVKTVDVGFSIYKNRSLVTAMYVSYLGACFKDLQKFGEFRFLLRDLPLSSGRYEVGVRVFANSIETDCPTGPIASFEVNRSDFYRNHDMSVENRSTVLLDGEWKGATIITQ